MNRISPLDADLGPDLDTPSGGAPIQISPEALDAIRSLTYRLSGIVLNESKAGLVVARLRRRLRARNLQTYEEYVQFLSDNPEPEELGHFIDALSTNVTSFFREPKQFDLLRETLIRIRDAGQTQIRIWSAACSTGEEPYSMAMVARDIFRSSSVDLRILATDISGRALDHARNAVYDVDDLASVPESLRDSFVVPTAEEGKHAIVNDVRSLVTFARINLAQTPYPMHGPLDVIFCRNVMIYFDQRVRSGFLSEARRLLSPQGHLVVASSESTIPSTDLFHVVAPATFQRNQE